MHRRHRLGLALLVAASLWAATAGAQQDLGHKTLGTVGLLAGAQPPRGVFVADRFVYYAANTLIDRDGAELPVGLDLDAWADALGVGATFELAPLRANWSAALAVPVIRSSTRTALPEASIDRFGLGDLYLSPVQLGWRLGQFDLVTGYGLYAPTGRFEPGGADGVGRGHWTHQLSLGATAYFDRARRTSLSALAAYDHNLRKRGVDITRGDTVQVQGGLGVRLGPVTAGLAAYALWQVEDDSGADLPPALAGARERAFGLGPEIQVAIPPLRSLLTLRYERDLSVRARPQGQLFFAALSFAAWRPAPEGAAQSNPPSSEFERSSRSFRSGTSASNSTR